LLKLSSPQSCASRTACVVGGTSAEQVQNKCRTSAEQVQNKCRTSAEQVQNKCRKRQDTSQ
jgi:hypothetical protein